MKQGGVIAAVQPGSIGEELGLGPGDRLIAINGHVLRDLIDYQYYSADEQLVLEIDREGQRYRLEVERDYGETLGLTFAELVFDGMRQCDNRCPFCFVRQMPPGMRRTLYVRDDDYRYSFLLGNFVTLTNLTETDWQRIETQHLSPLYVSIHATDTAVRQRVLGNPRAPDIMDQLRRLQRIGIEVHGQIVIWPGVNDGVVLRRSVEALTALWPTLRTLAIVPVGLTRYHHGEVRLLTSAEAAAILDLVEAMIPAFRVHFGRTWLYPADEMFLLAGRPVPPRDFYDDPAQRENGVGLVRLLLDDWQRVTKRPPRRSLTGRRITLVCGTLIAPILRELAAVFESLTGIETHVVPVVNRVLGDSVTVSGLLFAQDVIATLEGRPLGERVFVPRAMFDAEGKVTLDDLSLEAFAERLGASTFAVTTMSEVVAACCG